MAAESFESYHDECGRLRYDKHGCGDEESGSALNDAFSKVSDLLNQSAQFAPSALLGHLRSFGVSADNTNKIGLSHR